MPDTVVTPRVDDPGYWRFRAENARKLAKELKEPEAKATILSVAEHYDHLARLAQDRRRSAS